MIPGAGAMIPVAGAVMVVPAVKARHRVAAVRVVMVILVAVVIPGAVVVILGVAVMAVRAAMVIPGAVVVILGVAVVAVMVVRVVMMTPGGLVPVGSEVMGERRRPRLARKVGAVWPVGAQLG